MVAPADWKEVRLGEIAEIISGGTPSTAIGSYWGGDIPWCTPTDITSCKSNYLFETERKITPAGLAGSAASLLPPGSLLLCTRATVGDVRIASRAIATNQGFKSLVVNSQTNSKFVYFVLQTLRQAMIEKSSGSTFLELGKNDLSNIVALMPPLKEQEAIAESLSDADTAIESLDALIAKKRDVKQATMQQLLTGRTRLPGFTADWKEVRLGECLTIMHGKNQSQVVDPEGRYPILATGGVIGRTNSYLSNKPSVLIGRKGTIDRPQYMDTPFWTVDTLFYSEVKNGNSAKFLFYKFLMVDWKKYNEASGVPSLNASTIENVEMMMPPLKEQEAIAEALTVMEDELEALNEQVLKLRMVKEGMMQDLLTGRVRLV